MDEAEALAALHVRDERRLDRRKPFDADHRGVVDHHGVVAGERGGVAEDGHVLREVERERARLAGGDLERAASVRQRVVVGVSERTGHHEDLARLAGGGGKARAHDVRHLRLVRRRHGHARHGPLRRGDGERRHHREALARRRVAPHDLLAARHLEGRRAAAVLDAVRVRADDEVPVLLLPDAAQVGELQLGGVRARELPHHLVVGRILGDGVEMGDERVAVGAAEAVEGELRGDLLLPHELARPVVFAHEVRARAAHEVRALVRLADHAIAVVHAAGDRAVGRRGVALEPHHGLPGAGLQLRDEARAVLGHHDVAVLEHLEAEHALLLAGFVKKLVLARDDVDAPQVAVGVVDPFAVLPHPVDVAAAGLVPGHVPVRRHEERAPRAAHEKRLAHRPLHGRIGQCQARRDCGNCQNLHLHARLLSDYNAHASIDPRTDFADRVLRFFILQEV